MAKKMVNQTAVENFMASLDINFTQESHQKNLIRDAYLYGWSVETIQTIWEKIKEKYYIKSFMDRLFSGVQNERHSAEK